MLAVPLLVSSLPENEDVCCGHLLGMECRKYTLKSPNLNQTHFNLITLLGFTSFLFFNGKSYWHLPLPSQCQHHVISQSSPRFYCAGNQRYACKHLCALCWRMLICLGGIRINTPSLLIDTGLFIYEATCVRFGLKADSFV